MTSSSREDEIKTLLSAVFLSFSEQLKGYQVFLFGSRAAHTARPRSDFDVGVYGKKPLSLKVFYDIEDKLEELPTLYKIDWVDFNRASPKFRQRTFSQPREILYAGKMDSRRSQKRHPTA